MSASDRVPRAEGHFGTSLAGVGEGGKEGRGDEQTEFKGDRKMGK